MEHLYKQQGYTAAVCRLAWSLSGCRERHFEVCTGLPMLGEDGTKGSAIANVPQKPAGYTSMELAVFEQRIGVGIRTWQRWLLSHTQVGSFLSGLLGRAHCLHPVLSCSPEANSSGVKWPSSRMEPSRLRC